MNFQPYEYARNFKTVKRIFYLLQKYIFGEDKRISKTWKENKIFVILKSAKKWKNNPPKFRFSQGYIMYRCKGVARENLIHT